MDADKASGLLVLLFETWYPSLTRYASRSTGSFELAEDLVQETFMQLYRELRKGKEVTYPKAWTLCVLRRAIGKSARNYARTGARTQSLEVLEELPARPSPSGTDSLEFDEATRLFAVLTSREEEVVLLRMEALKYREIAARLGISPNSVNTLLARALRKLQNAAKKNAEKQPGTDYVQKRLPKTLQ